MNFEYKLAELRRAHGLTKEELSQKLDISNKTILDLENGNLKPTDIQLNKICSLFKISKELLNNDDKFEDLLDSLYLNKNTRISYNDSVTTITLNKKQTIIVSTIIFIVLALILFSPILFAIILSKTL